MSNRMPLTETQLHRRIDAKIEASERARATPPNPWKDPRWACPACGGRPLAGFSSTDTLDVVMATSVARDGLVWVRTASGATLPTCGPNCTRELERQVERGTAPPFERVQISVDRAPVKPSEPKTVVDAHLEAHPSRRQTARCARSGCNSVTHVDQTQLPDGTWSPPIASILRLSGWEVSSDGTTYCGSWCRTYVDAMARRAAAEDKAGTGIRTPVAVETMPDASFNAHRTRERAAAGMPATHGPLATPFMTGRDLSDGPTKPAKKGAR